MNFLKKFVNYPNFYILFGFLIWEFDYVNSYNLDYDNNPQGSPDFTQQPVKPIGHPKFTPRLTQEQIELPNPYLVNGNTYLNQINCEGANCHQPDQINHPYIQNTGNGIKKFNDDNIFPYGGINVNSMIDGQYHKIEQQPSFNPNIETNLPTSTYQNNFNLNQPSQNSFNQEQLQQQSTYGTQMENSNYKIVPHVSNNNVDINFILEQQNEHLRVLLHNIKQQQLKLMQTIMDIQQYVETLPTRTRYWSEKQIENQQKPINFYIQPVRDTIQN